MHLPGVYYSLRSGKHPPQTQSLVLIVVANRAASYSDRDLGRLQPRLRISHCLGQRLRLQTEDVLRSDLLPVLHHQYTDRLQLACTFTTSM